MAMQSALPVLLLKQASAEGRCKFQSYPRTLSPLSLKKALCIRGWLRDASLFVHLAKQLLDPAPEVPA